ncbi:MAG TPA: hypothetical protein VIB99_08635 [Candidatus Limnocylindrales bacterium]|jgi:hypothetical protein
MVEPALEFPIRIQPNLKPLLLFFGVHDDGRALVRIDGTSLSATFGRFHARTDLSNIERWDITGPYRSLRAFGVRRTIGTHDLSFGGSAHGGVRLHFRSPVRAARVPNSDLYLTVDDLEGFGAALTARGIPGADLRSKAS